MHAQPQLRKITCLGFDWRAEVSLKETLALLKGMTVDRWQYADDLMADVVVYDSSNALAQAIVRRNAADPQPPRVFFPSHSDDERELTLRLPFGATKLIRCLDVASQRLAGHASPSARLSRDSLCQALDNALHVPGVLGVGLHTAKASGLLLPGESILRWPTAMGIDEAAQLLTGDVEVHPFGPDDLAAMRRFEVSGGVAGSAEGLLWAIGITRSGGSLLHRLNASRGYRLRRWPNFGLIGRRATDLRCTSLLTQRPLTAASLATLTGLPLGVIGSFLNAAALCGLLEEARSEAIAAPPSATTATREAGIGGMLRRIRVALALD